MQLEQRSTRKAVLRPRVAEAFELFLLDCEARQFTAHTLRFYRGRLTLFVAWCDEQALSTVADITPAHVRHYLVDTQRRGTSSAYVHSHARALRTFFNYCVRDGFLDSSPFTKVKMPRLEKKILSALTNAEVQQLLGACSTERDRALVPFLLDSGVRASELCALDLADVTLESGTVHVRLGKGQKGRSVYIGPQTRKQLGRYLRLERPAHSPALFVPERGGDRLSYSGLSQILKRLRRATSIAHCSAHALRRTFAINCLRGGMNIYILAKLMGHSDITVLRQYLELVEDDLHTAHSQASVLERMLSRKT